MMSWDFRPVLARGARAVITIVVLATSPCVAQDALVLTGVRVVDVRAARILDATTLVIVDGLIVALGPDGEVDVPPSARRVDGHGRFAIPGLWDMHVHLVEHEELLPLFVAHGVTGVRVMGGDPAACLDVRARIAGSELLGPRIVTCGPFLDGRAEGDSRWEVLTREDATQAVGRLKDLGVDFVKVHELVPRDTLAAILDEAREVGLPVAGHVPRGVTPEDAVALGLASLEHANQLAERLLTRHALDASEALDGQIAALLEGRARELFEAMVTRGAAYTPTLVAHAGILHGADPTSGVWDDPRLRLVPAWLRAEWEASLPVEMLPPDFLRERRSVHQAARALVGGMHDAGVMLLAGSDVGAPHVHPGSSLHDELEELVACGLTPGEALAAATTAPADFLGLAGTSGEIAVGRLADLVLLTSDPLLDIAALRQIDAVVRRGTLLVREDLDALLAVCAEAVVAGEGGPGDVSEDAPDVGDAAADG